MIDWSELEDIDDATIEHIKVRGGYKSGVRIGALAVIPSGQSIQLSAPLVCGQVACQNQSRARPWSPAGFRYFNSDPNTQK